MIASCKLTQLLSHILFLFILSDAHAQQALTLQEAFSVALKNSPEFIIAQQKLKQADEKIAQTWGMLYPIIESEASVLRQYAENGFMSLSDDQWSF